VQWLLILIIATSIFGEGFIGESGNNVVLVNATGLKITRIIIGERTYEDVEIQNKADKILVNVTPKKHHLELYFRGGAHIDWPRFDFANVHEIVFDLAGNRVVAHPK
jgi:hypothetical protein